MISLLQSLANWNLVIRPGVNDLLVLENAKMLVELDQKRLVFVRIGQKDLDHGERRIDMARPLLARFEPLHLLVERGLLAHAIRGSAACGSADYADRPEHRHARHQRQRRRLAQLELQRGEIAEGKCFFADADAAIAAGGVEEMRAGGERPLAL